MKATGRSPRRPGGAIYSNTGIELAAAHLESAAGCLSVSTLSAVCSNRWVWAKPSSTARPPMAPAGRLGDLLALAGELLAPSLVSPETWQVATSVAWPGLAGVLPGFGRQDPCDWGLGPEIRSHKSPHWTGSANSPSDLRPFWPVRFVPVGRPRSRDSRVAALSSTPFGPWAKEAWPALSDAVLAAYGTRHRRHPAAKRGRAVRPGRHGYEPASSGSSCSSVRTSAIRSP